MQNPEVMTRTARCLIVSASPLIAEDIAETLCEKLEGASVESFLRANAALTALETGPDVLVAFAVMSADTLATSGLVPAVRARGGQVIIVGTSLPQEELQQRGWLLLPEPFSAEMIEDVLKSVLRA